jgi:hypothetical protein
MKAPILVVSAVVFAAAMSGCTTFRPNEVSKTKWAQMSVAERNSCLAKRNYESQKTFDEFRRNGDQQIRDLQAKAQPASEYSAR